MASLLPQASGLLPKWIGFIGLVAIINGTSGYFGTRNAQETYNQTQAAATQPLIARLFGIWTITSGIIRLYTAYHIESPELYVIAFASYVLALTHFGLELVVFRSLRLSRVTLMPMIVASSSLVWMWAQWDYYVG